MSCAACCRYTGMSYADIDGISLYYEEHGSGEPLVLLHGGLGAGELFAPILPALASERRVIVIDLPGHGHSANPCDRPLRAQLLADDVAGLIEHLGLGRVDVMGYSLGGMVALRTAIQHPHRVRKLVLVSVAFQRAGNHAEVIATMDAMQPEIAELMKQSPLYAMYERIAPRAEDFDTLVAKTAEFLKDDYDWTAEVAKLTAPALLVYADADSIKPSHIVEAYALLGGGLRDANWDGSQRPVNQLAILPGQTHYDVSTSPNLVPAVLPFLQSSSPQ
jgi:pimeloyl-ACP methyl ester carboxylesterase